ncbi:MAG: ABC transporter ATP-binding protein/permease [Spirochaetes bacterium]|nr:ABC transporter ATP-binding protein/permease [Spirochaetota bacterium]
MSTTLKHFKPYTIKALITIILVAIAALLNLYLPNMMSNIVNKGITKQDIYYIIQIGLKMLFISLISVIFGVLSHLTSAKIAASYAKDLRYLVFNKVTSFSLAEFDSFSTASLINRNTNDIIQIQQFSIMMMRMVIRAPILSIGGIIMAFSINSKLSSILFVSLPLLFFGISLLIIKTMPLFKQLQNKIDKINLIVRENILGVRVIRAFNKEDYEESRFNLANIDLTRSALLVNRINSIIFPLMMFIMNFTTIAIISYGVKLIDLKKLNIGDLMAVLQYVIQILFAFGMISVIFTFLPRAVASINRIDEVLNKENSIKDKVTKLNKNVTTISKLKNKEIIFDNVTFYYPLSKEPVLENISLSIPENKTTAIIGNTGAGKSTLIYLLLRFYDVSSGKITIGNIDIRDFNQNELRNLFGYSPQKPIIFSNTIFDNIKFGREINENDILNAANIAMVSEFAEKMQHKFYSIIAQGGTNLSGGQKQRISIARAIAEKKFFYIFDDSFSALDFKTDSKIRSELKKFCADSTVIIVSQRVATILDADQIIVLEDGKIAGIGNHNSLLKTCEVYKNFVKSQLSEEDILHLI